MSDVYRPTSTLDDAKACPACDDKNPRECSGAIQYQYGVVPCTCDCHNGFDDDDNLGNTGD